MGTKIGKTCMRFPLFTEKVMLLVLNDLEVIKVHSLLKFIFNTQNYRTGAVARTNCDCNCFRSFAQWVVLDGAR